MVMLNFRNKKKNRLQKSIEIEGDTALWISGAAISQPSVF